MKFFILLFVFSLISLAEEKINPPQAEDLIDISSLNIYAVKTLAMKPLLMDSSDSHFSSYQETDIYLAFKNESIESVAAHGFLNNHQTKTSLGTANNRIGRAEIEDFLISGLNDFKLEETYSSIKDPNDYRRDEFRIHFLRPKYAFVVSKENSKIFKKSLSGRHYGDVYAVLKDEVKLRSTFTLRDSLNAKNKIIRGESPVYTFRQNFSKTIEREGDYFEAQIFGSLSGTDVDHFIVGCRESSYEYVVSRLKAAFPGIPVYLGIFKQDKNKSDVCRVVHQL